MIPDVPTMVVPLRTDEHGTIRIGKTRVLLELVSHATIWVRRLKVLSIAIPV